MTGIAAQMLYPRAANCLCCGDPRRAEEDSLCPACREKLKLLRVPASACDRCLSPVRQGEKCRFCASKQMKAIEKVYAPYRYAAEARTLIHRFKFQSCDEALPLLAGAMAEALSDRSFDCIVPVPLHPKRMRSRGFNQSSLLAGRLAAETGIPVRELLIRVKYHRPQSRTPMKQRQRNVDGAFACPEDASGLRILLVDDVRTSGSTACACAETLKAAGAARVSLCTAAVVYRKKG